MCVRLYVSMSVCVRVYSCIYVKIFFSRGRVLVLVGVCLIFFLVYSEFGFR